MYDPNLYDNKKVDYQKHLPPYRFTLEQLGIIDGIIPGVNEAVIQHRQQYPFKPITFEYKREIDWWGWFCWLDFYIPILTGVYNG